MPLNDEFDNFFSISLRTIWSYDYNTTEVKMQVLSITLKTVNREARSVRSLNNVQNVEIYIVPTVHNVRRLLTRVNTFNDEFFHLFSFV